MENAPVVARDRRIMREPAQDRRRRIDQAPRSNRATQLQASLRGGLVDGDPVGRFSAGKTYRSCAAKPEAKYVKFTSFFDPGNCPEQRSNESPWPYTEGLTIAEARNELAFLVIGLYGKPRRNQNGAPIRLAVPWKYGF